MTNLIIKKICKSISPRVVVVASDRHRMSPIRFYDYNFDVCHARVPPGANYDFNFIRREEKRTISGLATIQDRLYVDGAFAGE